MASPRFDMARFGAEVPRFSPRQADLLWVVGTISQRQAPALKRIYEQMADPKWVLAFGTCALVRRLLRQLHDPRRHRQGHPCDVYMPGCPPRPEAVLDGLMLLQDKIARGDRTPAIVKPREDPRADDGAAHRPPAQGAEPTMSKKVLNSSRRSSRAPSWRRTRSSATTRRCSIPPCGATPHCSSATTRGP